MIKSRACQPQIAPKERAQQQQHLDLEPPLDLAAQGFERPLTSRPRQQQHTQQQTL
jgi:hypothetical protein